MSEEEHSTLSTLTRSVSELAGSVRVLSDNQGRLEKIVTKMADGRQMSLGNIATFVGIFGVAVGMIVTVNTMTIKGAIHDEVTPLRTKFYVRNAAQDIYLNQLWRDKTGNDLPPYPPAE